MTINAAQGSRLVSLCPSGTGEVEAFAATLDTEVTRLFVCNVTASPVNIRVWHVDAGDVVAAKYALFYDYPIAAGTTLQLISEADNSGVQLKTGDEIHVQASTADALAINIYGVTAAIAPGAAT